jgi:serine/threonine protein kinase
VLRAAAGVNHPALPAIYYLGEANGTSYVALEHVEGITLQQRIAAGPVPLQEALRIGAQVAGGLGAAHARGLVHGSVRPDNIVVQQDGCAKILGLGLPEHRRALPSWIAYLSPEQTARAEPAAVSDVWSLGTLLYELACGSNPFKSATPGETKTRIQAAQIPEMPSQVPASLQSIIRRALSRDPKARYFSAAQMVGEIQAVAPDNGTLNGMWRAKIIYRWDGWAAGMLKDEVTEDLTFDLDGEVVCGTVTFRGTKCGFMDGKLNGNRLAFTTESRRFSNRGERVVTLATTAKSPEMRSSSGF